VLDSTSLQYLMSKYMVTFELPIPFTAEFIERIPEQRQIINELLTEQKIHSYSLSMNRDRLWCMINADSRYEVVNVINTFPLIDYMPYDISELMFHNVASIQVPAFSLN
jgi:muconolactone delta-isomerase